MTEQDKAEKNRKLAEWIEPFESLPPIKDEWFSAVLAGECIRSPKSAWIVAFHYEDGDAGRYESADFYRSEEASALLREKLRSLDCHILMDRAGVTVYGPIPEGRGWRNTLVRNEPITMTAIAEAMLRLMESK